MNNYINQKQTTLENSQSQFSHTKLDLVYSVHTTNLTPAISCNYVNQKQNLNSSPKVDKGVTTNQFPII